KQKLLAGMMLEVIVTANVDHRRRFGVWRGVTLASMGKELDSEFQALAEGILHQECAEWKVAVLGLRDYCLAAAAVQEPVPEILLQPQRNFVPNMAYAQTL